LRRLVAGPQDASMLSAYARLPNSTTRKLDGIEAVRALWNTPEAQFWIDLEAPTVDELADLDTVINLDDLALADCLAGEQLPRIDEYENYIFAVLYGAFGPAVGQPFEPRKLAAFLGQRFLITIHREYLRTVATLRERAQRHSEQVLRDGPDGLFATIVDMMSDNYLLAAERYADRVDELEEDALIAPVAPDLLGKVADLRKELLENRRVATAQRELMTPLAAGDYDYVSPDLGMRFSRVRDHLTVAIERIDGMRERLRGVVEAYHTSISTQTNQVMRTLTIFATIMLPLSVISGFFGMNVPLGPFASHWSAPLVVLGVMATLAISLLVYFRKQGWM
jgi:magnesium transporter